MFRFKALLQTALVVSLMAVAPSEATAKTGDIIARLGPGSSPSWSPDGKLISFIHEGYLQVTPADGKGARTKLAEYKGQSYVWASDTEIVWAQKPSQYSDTTYFNSIILRRDCDSVGLTSKIQGGATPSLMATAIGDRSAGRHIGGPVRLPNGVSGYFETSAGINSGRRQFHPLSRGAAGSIARWGDWAIVVVEPQPNSVFGDLWLGRSGDTSLPMRRLSQGERYGLVEMAPTGDKLVARRMPGSGYTVIDTSGRILTARFEPARDGVKPGTHEGASRLRWSPDGHLLAVVRSVEDENTVLAERLMVSDVSNEHPVEVVGYDAGELGVPAWRPDSRAIAIGTEREGILILEVAP